MNIVSTVCQENKTVLPVINRNETYISVTGPERSALLLLVAAYTLHQVFWFSSVFWHFKSFKYDGWMTCGFFLRPFQQYFSHIRMMGG